MILDYGSGGSLSVTMDGPFGSAGTAVKLTSFTAPADGWKGAVSPYSQVVQLPGVSSNSKVDLQLPHEVLEQLRGRELSFTACNDGGVVTLFAFGDKPEEDLTFQATLMEVVA